MVDKYDRIWTVEHGPRGGDELNLIMPGNNYGWPESTLGTNYDTTPVKTASQYGRHDHHTPPVFSWIPSRGVSNLIQVNGFHPAWDGDFLIATMVSERLYRIRVTDKGAVLFSEPICMGRRVRSIHQHTNGVIYAWTDDQVLYVIKGPQVQKKPNMIHPALFQCMDCHYNGGSAPTLAAIKTNNSRSESKST